MRMFNINLSAIRGQMRAEVGGLGEACKPSSASPAFSDHPFFKEHEFIHSKCQGYEQNWRALFHEQRQLETLDHITCKLVRLYSNLLG